MSQLNTAQLCGNLTHDPELKTFNGRSFCSFQVANTRTWVDHKNEEKSRSNFIPVTAWGAVAESIEQAGFIKGSFVIIEGDIQSSSYMVGDQRRTKVFLAASSISSLESARSQQEPTPPALSIPDPDIIDPADIPF